MQSKAVNGPRKIKRSHSPLGDSARISRAAIVVVQENVKKKAPDIRGPGRLNRKRSLVGSESDRQRREKVLRSCRYSCLKDLHHQSATKQTDGTEWGETD